MLKNNKLLNIGFTFLMLFFVSCGIDMPEPVEIAYQELPDEVDFNFHVKPILSDRCYSCHGLEANICTAGLRLDIEKVAFKKLTSNEHAFVAGNPGASK